MNDFFSLLVPMIFRLNPAIQAVKRTTGAIDVMYTLINTNGVRYEQKDVGISDLTDGDMRGTLAKVILQPLEGIGTTFEGDFTIPKGATFGEKDTYLRVSIFVDNNGVLERKGDGIVSDDDVIDE